MGEGEEGRGDDVKSDIRVLCPNCMRDVTDNSPEANRAHFRKDCYEWKAVSEYLRENPGRTPDEDGWELVGGALRRVKK